MISRAIFVALMSLAAATAAATELVQPADRPSLQSGTVTEAADRLQPGEFLWAPQFAPSGPLLLVVSLASQRAVVYRNGVPIGISTVSTGRPGHETPIGVFAILQKRIEHYSNIYDDAPMPYMQRLTWGGVALHAGNLPGYPASHGCIRLPQEFARLLYGVTHHGMTVVITKQQTVPRVAPADGLLVMTGTGVDPKMWWNSARSPSGPLSIVLSASDRRLVVLRNAIAIGHAAVEIDGGVNRTTAYVLNGILEGKRSWSRIALPGQDDQASEALSSRVHVTDAFRKLVDPVLTVGTTVIVTGDSLRGNGSSEPAILIEAEASSLSH